jgi:uncharacterized protein YfbU (UPF0304 family)
MNLTDAEKLILHNQYEILGAVQPSRKKDYVVLLECLYSGYEEDFEQLIPHFEDPQSPQVYNQVRGILEMFRSITPNAGTGIKPTVVFAGFDGNEETQHFAYARFLLEDRDLWRESHSNDLNTHTPVLEDYLEMFHLWEAAGDKNNLTAGEFDAIVAKAPYASRHHSSLI